MPHTYEPPAYEQAFFPAGAFDIQSAFKQHSPLREPMTVLPEHVSPAESSFPNSSPRISDSGSSDAGLYSPPMGLATPFNSYIESSYTTPHIQTSCMPTPQMQSPVYNYGAFPHAQLTADGHGLILPASQHDANATTSFQMGAYYTSAFATYDPFVAAAGSAPMPFGFHQVNAMHSTQAAQAAYALPVRQAGSSSPSTSSDSALLDSPLRHASLPAQVQTAFTIPIPNMSSPTKPKRRTLSHSANSADAAEDGIGRAKIHVCPTCSRCFSRSHDMRRHIRGHSLGSQHKCSECGHGFRRLDAVKRHLRTACRGPGQPPAQSR